jgi:hypothetical protein
MTMSSNELSPEEIRLAANWSWHRLTGLSFGGNPAAPTARAIYGKAQARDRVARAEIRRVAEIEENILLKAKNGPVGELDIARQHGITPIEAQRFLDAMEEGGRLTFRQRKAPLSTARLAMGTPPLLDALALKKRDDHSRKLAKRVARAAYQKRIASAEDCLLVEKLRRDILREIAQTCVAEAHKEGALVTKPNAGEGSWIRQRSAPKLVEETEVPVTAKKASCQHAFEYLIELGFNPMQKGNIQQSRFSYMAECFIDPGSRRPFNPSTYKPLIRGCGQRAIRRHIPAIIARDPKREFLSDVDATEKFNEIKNGNISLTSERL